MNLDRRLLRLARQSRIALVLTVGIGFAAGVFTILQAGLLTRLVDGIFLQGLDRDAVAGLLAGLAAAMAVRALLVWAGDLTAASISAHIKTGLRLSLYRRLLDLGPARLGGERTGELTYTLLEGVETLDAYFSQYLPGLALAAVVPLTILVVVFPLDPLSGLALLLTAPLIPVFMILIGSTSQTLTRRQWETLSRMSAYFLDVLQGLTTLKLFGRSRYQVRGVAEVGERFRQTTMSVLRVTFLSALVLEMVATLSTAVVAVQMGLRLLYGRLDFSEAFFILLLAPEFYLPLRLLGTRFHAGMSGAAAANRIFEILEDEAKTGAQPTPPLEDAGPEVDRSEVEDAVIRFDHVSFSYDGVYPALTDLSFEIQPGETVALVGPSGGGKSTLASLLLGFLEPSSGSILVGNLPPAAIAGRKWLDHVGWVSQQPVLFNDTIFENIRLGKPEASIEQVAAAARLAQVDDFIRDLPQGYETRVGEGGARLSAGQAQRVALARAFMRGAPVFILDEPSANLDLESESRLQAGIESLLIGRTALVIAHRLPTVKSADRICVINDGRLAAQGTHEQLLESSTLYRRMVGAYAAKGNEEAERPIEAWQGKPQAEDAVRSRPIVSRDTSSAEAPTTRLGMSSLLPGSALFAVVDTTLAGGEGNTAPGAWAALLRLLGFLRPYRRWVLLSALAGAATTLSGVGLMSASAYIISAAALHPSIAELQVAIVGVRFFGIARGLFRYLERVSAHETTFRLLANLRVWFYQAIEPLVPARLIHQAGGDLLARIQSDIGSLENFYVRVAAPPLSALLVGVTVWVLMFAYHRQAALAWLALWLAAGIALPAVALRLGRRAGERQVTARAVISNVLTESIQGLPEVIVYDRSGDRLERIEALSQALAAAVKGIAKVNGLQTAIGGLLANLSVLTTVSLAIPAVQSGELSGVYVASLALAALTSFEAVAPLPTAAQYWASSLQSAWRLFALADAAPAVVVPAEPASLRSTGASGVSLAVRDLSFRYPPASVSGPMTLDKISLDLPAGAHFGLVGPSGAGKSTVVSLLLRFWDYEGGEIWFDGQDIRRLDPETVRAQMGVIGQRAYLFNASVRDNLRLARPQATEDEIVDAARRAQLHARILQLPQGYDTLIGERGGSLSGGERQRLALARVLLKNAPLMILDEPTVGLDALTEREVLREIFEQSSGRSLLLVTHRLVEMERLDQILVLDGGQIVARGAHAELLAKDGPYRRMWDLQREILNQE